MKIKFHISIITLSIALFGSCKKDNYDPPSSTLTGRLVYNGEPIEVEVGQVPFQLYQFGFGRVAPIQQSFAQDGSYSSLLFDGDYKFTIPGGQGPFIWKQTASGAPDSISISLKGSQELNIEVTPYYMVRTPQFSFAGGKVSATFKAEKIVTGATGRNIERVNLYINRTQFVSAGTNNIASAELAGNAITDVNNIALNVTVPALTPAQGYVFARVGLKVEGIEDLIFSPVQKVQIQ